MVDTSAAEVARNIAQRRNRLAIYYLERIPSKIYWSELVVNAAITMALGVFFAFVPAVIAAFRPPIRAIRHD